MEYARYRLAACEVLPRSLPTASGQFGSVSASVRLCMLLPADGSGCGDPEGGARYLLLQLVEDADWRP